MIRIDDDVIFMNMYRRIPFEEDDDIEVELFHEDGTTSTDFIDLSEIEETTTNFACISRYDTDDIYNYYRFASWIYINLNYVSTKLDTICFVYNTPDNVNKHKEYYGILDLVPASKLDNNKYYSLYQKTLFISGIIPILTNEFFNCINGYKKLSVETAVTNLNLFSKDISIQSLLKNIEYNTEFRKVISSIYSLDIWDSFIKFFEGPKEDLKFLLEIENL